MTDAELERRKTICRGCEDLKARGGAAFCGREACRPDGRYCEPWAVRQYGRRLLARQPHCPQWEVET
jgi:hypothetical protein